MGLGTADNMISAFKDIALETIQEKKKKTQKKYITNRVSVSWGRG